MPGRNAASKRWDVPVRAAAQLTRGMFQPELIDDPVNVNQQSFPAEGAKQASKEIDQQAAYRRRISASSVNSSLLRV